MFNIVLYEPEIPQNTGNIARLCAATGCCLHLIEPLGFSLQNRYLKRAGLDYWHLVRVYCYSSFQEFKSKFPSARFFYITTKGKFFYHNVEYKEGDFFIFGKETTGLPEDLIAENLDFCLRIPMVKEARCLNLSNSVAIIIYEALRQQKFKGLS
ncbi:MAG: tRNA (uridine(34)/cytosine(34)/5-carboxymethylaminomethyluridine(34)-2'-O)-methyltransferase TrmL [Firmicutes bacterium]|nr:tRNA (uridine(34)/cytosine(34)/5-carboxymethylaminomethyluridine(34)-2'-O)-methyltransferase TrmL [Bacillota bacterium]